jgi:hypothetical protein
MAGAAWMIFAVMDDINATTGKTERKSSFTGSRLRMPGSIAFKGGVRIPFWQRTAPLIASGGLQPMSDALFSNLFADPAAWQVFASGQAEGRLEGIPAKKGIRLDYDFHDGGGFVVIRREIPLKLPQTFRIRFELRGDGPPNHFEVKVADPGGTNVWRHLQQDFGMPQDWEPIAFTERDLPFAWGPAGGGAPSEVGAIEFVIAAGPGGVGSFELAMPSLDDEAAKPPFGFSASSHQADFPPAGVMEGGGWKADEGDGRPMWSVDLGRELRFGGLVIEWPEPLPPRAYRVEASLDGARWNTVHDSRNTRGRISHLSTPRSEARYLRLVFEDAAGAALDSLTLKPDAFSSTPNEFVHNVAADFPRGWFPRYWHREQSYWTPIGSPLGKRRALINEEGMVETDEAGFSLEPFVLTEDGLVTWNEVEKSLALEAEGSPLPSVFWKADGFHLEILPWVDGRLGNLTLHVTYRLKSKTPARLCVAVRPFQVNPPWQAFRNLGGRSPIHEMHCTADGMMVEGRRVLASPCPHGSGTCSFEEGGVMAYLAHLEIPPTRSVHDAGGLASGVMQWTIPPGKSTLEATVSVPFFSKASKGSRRAAVSRWRKTLGDVQWQAPACAQSVFDAWRTAAGHILINRDGPAIQPGPRRYTRSWVRDCVIMGAALAKAGLPDALRVFLRWYAGFQRKDGFIPCVVDRDGVDWLVEHDSHGQFLWGLAEVLRNDGDLAFSRRMYPKIRKAAEYLISLRSQRLTESYRSGEHAACYGLLPESASHEGYLAHPVHSYWDDFWGVRGLEAAADLGAALGSTDDSCRWKNAAAEFQADLLKSIERVIAAKSLSYIPGSVEWADFDPTATSNAIAQLDFADVLPEGPLHAMLDTYLEGFRRKHGGGMVWNNYTAYEIRIIGAFVRLGKRAEANELLDFFLSDRRPREWNQWPEITWKDPRSPGHLGDVPHTWIAAEYLLAVASMVASEREADESLVLASGMPWEWIGNEPGFTVHHLPTRFGRLDFHLSSDGQKLRLIIGGTLVLPPGGLWVTPPLPSGKTWIGKEGQVSVKIRKLPFQALLAMGGTA